VTEPNTIIVAVVNKEQGDRWNMDCRNEVNRVQSMKTLFFHKLLNILMANGY